ncbi:MAG TPA: hypothetical protein VJN32_00210 [Dehalococcoidia bacterium]|nr:hypothetical protein [Dehalococcoidia bacterium]
MPDLTGQTDYTVTLVLRRRRRRRPGPGGTTSRITRRIVMLTTASAEAAEHVLNQAQGATPNWDAGHEIAYAWDGFSEDDQAILQKEGFGP